MFCENEIKQSLEKLELGIPVFSSNTIDKYIECAKKQNFVAKYFPVVDSGFIVYKNITIFLISKDEGTILSTNPNSDITLIRI